MQKSHLYPKRFRRQCQLTGWYHSDVRALLRSHFRFFLLATLAGLALRLLFLFLFPAITSDSLIYGDIAKNWLQHGVYGVHDGAAIVPTYIRLPGYPAFLALIFSVFGMEHYRAVLAVQILVDLASCLLIADMARRLLSDRAGKVAFLLAALCPFFANYAAAALTETLEIFFTVLALDLGMGGLTVWRDRRLLPWLGCGLATGCAILLRPDGGLLLMAVGGYLGIMAIVSFIRKSPSSTFRFLQAGIALGVVSLAPLVPWSLRNLHTLHNFEPLAPRYATGPGEFVPLGFERWMRTWIVDYVSVEEIYWSVPDSQIDVSKLPSRAFDSEAQRQQTEQLLDDYNEKLHVTPELDARFARLAADRIQQSPLRYYLWLPAARIADMWLRPRTEILPSDSRWWEFNDDPKWSALAVALGVINLLYVGTAVFGFSRIRSSSLLLLPVAFLIVRSLFLGLLENPETRYTLECYPTIILLICFVSNNLRVSAAKVRAESFQNYGKL
jgi:4-amino-4-deoxy-L-arabinose transferase-like glycosyltransferase